MNCCQYREGCYKKGTKKKTYSETLICDTHSEQARFRKTEHFKEKMKERYKIEAKNSELKHRHGYGVASSSGLFGMEMQGTMAIFAVNLKRIIKLMGKNNQIQHMNGNKYHIEFKESTRTQSETGGFLIPLKIKLKMLCFSVPSKVPERVR